MQHFATNAYKKKMQGFKSDLSLPFEDYIINNPQLIENYKNKFYGNFPADKQVFQRDPLSKETIEFFKNSLPLEQKKKFGIFYSDLEKINLPAPANELKQIQEYYKKEKVSLLDK